MSVINLKYLRLVLFFSFFLYLNKDLYTIFFYSLFVDNSKYIHDNDNEKKNNAKSEGSLGALTASNQLGVTRN